MGKLKENKGITLIALIITIIVLIILAGVAINFIIGENGILRNSEQAKIEQEKAELKEELELAILDIQTDKSSKGQTMQREDLKELESIGAIIQSIGIPAEGEYKSYYFEVDEEYKVTILGKLKKEAPKIQAQLITQGPVGQGGTAQIKVTASISEGEIVSIEATNGAILKEDTSDTEKIFEVSLNGIYTFSATADNGRSAGASVEVDIIEGPIEIYTEEDLRNVAENLTKHYILMADIELTSTWTPLGSSTNQFTGRFYGNNHKITGLNNGTSTANYQGMFAYIGKEGKVNDLTLEGVQIKGTQNTGGLVGCNYGTIENVAITGEENTVTGTSNYTGGLVGFNYGTIKNVTSQIQVYGTHRTGGLVGFNDGSILNGKASGKIYITTSSVQYIGGLVGYNNSGKTIENCYTDVEITVNSASCHTIRYVGGLVGQNYGIINKSASSGVITIATSGTSYVGGLVGYNSGTISNAYSTGEVNTGTVGQYVGGLVGYSSGTITNVYTISAVKGSTTYVGGLVGYNNNGSTIVTNAYWTIEKSGVQVSAVGIGTNITWLIKKSNLSDKYDFEETWGIDDGKSLPYLNGLPIPEEVYVIEQGYEPLSKGSGTAEDPYIITTEEELNKVKYDLNASYKLGADIELTSTWIPIGASNAPFVGTFDGNNHKITGLNNGTSIADYQGMFASIGTAGKVYDLTLEGVQITGKQYVGGLAGYNLGTIENVAITGKENTVTGSSNHTGGLVGRNDGTINNIANQIQVYGTANTGGLVGFNNGSIANAKVTGNIYVNAASSQFIGGLVGDNNSGKTIESCYTDVEITVNSASYTNIQYVGGLVGQNSGTINKSASSGAISIATTGTSCIGGLVGCIISGATINNSYSTGEVNIGTVGRYIGGLVGYSNGTTTITNAYTISAVKGNSSYIGGLIGYKYSGSMTITNAYWTAEMAGVQTSAGGIETTITWLIKKANLSDKFDFEETWGIDDGKSLPYLNGLPIPEKIYVIEGGYVTFEEGSGTEEDPYIIKTEEQLNQIRYALKACYKLGANIELTNTWIPIGASNAPFTGKLDGNNHKITGLQNGTSTADYQGLFGYIGTGGKVNNLTVEGNISGKSYIGILAGLNLGTIESIKVSGNISINASSASDIGGLVGYNSSGTIEKCYSDVAIGVGHTNITSISRVGDLVGYNYGTINKSASSGVISIATSGISSVGGLVGANNGTINNSYSTGEVNTGTVGRYIGGLVGYSNGTTTITNAYTISAVKGNSYVGGLVGYKYSGKVTNAYWTIEKAGVETSDGGTPLTLEEMKTQSSYVGWDFESGTVWVMKEYPELVF